MERKEDVMPRRFVVALALAGVLGAAWVEAAEQATFILRDGHRVSGALATHGAAGTNYRAEFGEFSLATAEGLELVVPTTRLAVIDFAGGNPAYEELDALPGGNSHMIAFRDGTTRAGRLVDFVGGDRARFQGTGFGARQDVPVRNIARIYLDTQSARNLFNYRPGAFGRRGTQQQSGGGFGNIFGRGSSEDGIEIRGANQWTNTNLRVRQGEQIRFEATGRIYYMRTDDASAGPDGNPAMISKAYPVSGVAVGALIGRVGPNGQPFVIGGNRDPLGMPATGLLFLGINDDNFADNSGAFRVIVRRN
jgi:hypothetical protein